MIMIANQNGVHLFNATLCLGASWSVNSQNDSDPQLWLFGGAAYFNIHWNDMWALKCYCKYLETNRHLTR